MCGCRIRLTPPASASRHSPLRKRRHGQVDRRPATTSRRCRWSCSGRAGRRRRTAGPRRRSGRCRWSSRSPPPRASANKRASKSLVHWPTKTPVRLPSSAGGVDAGVFQRLPGGLEQQALLRVHALGLARRDAEESRVEVVRRRSRKPPRRLIMRPGVARRGSKNRSTSMRSAGTRPTASRPASSSFQKRPRRRRRRESGSRCRRWRWRG